jgi:hypothetical protein
LVSEFQTLTVKAEIKINFQRSHIFTSFYNHPQEKENKYIKKIKNTLKTLFEYVHFSKILPYLKIFRGQFHQPLWAKRKVAGAQCSAKNLLFNFTNN